MSKARDIADLGSNDVLETSSTGLDVTGTVTADGLTVDGASQLNTTGLANGLTITGNDNNNVKVRFDNIGTGGGDFVIQGGIQGVSNQGLSIRDLDNSAQRLYISSGGDVSFFEDTGTTAKMVWSSSDESLNLGGTANTNTAGFSQNLALKDLYPSITLEDTGTGTGKWTLGVTEGGIGFWDSVTTQYRMRIDSSGNVGIGTASPSAKLEIDGSASTDGILITNPLSGSFYNAKIEFRRDTTLGGAKIQSERNSSGGVGLSFNYTASNTAEVSGTYSEAMRIDSSGNLLVGRTTGWNLNSSVTGGVGIEGNGILFASRSNGSPMYAQRGGTDGDILEFWKDTSSIGSIGTYTQVAITSVGIDSANGIIILGGNDATAFQVVTSVGSSSPRIKPTSDNIADLGDNSYRFDDIYATNGTINTSDRNEKQDIEVLNDAEQRVAQACKGLLRKFRWQDSVAEKGDDARIHFGIIAQDLQDAFTAEGLDAGRYAMFISSTWTDEETGEERTRLGVRYPELLAFIISAL